MRRREEEEEGCRRRTGRREIVKEVRHLSLIEKPGGGEGRRDKGKNKQICQGLRGGIPRVEEI